MDITAVSKTHEIVVIAVIVAAAIFLLIRQFYRMAKGKDSGCASCSKSCSLKGSDSQCPNDDSNAVKDDAAENDKG